MELLSPVSIMLLVQKLIIVGRFNCLVFSSQLGFTVISLGLWSMGNDNDCVLIVTESQPGAPCCIGLFKSINYKGAIGVIDGTVQGKAVFDKGLNHWHKEVVSEIVGQLKHEVFGGDKEVMCRNSWQSYDYVEVNNNDRALEMQFEVILFLPGSWNIGYGSGMLYKYSKTFNSMSSPISHHQGYSAQDGYCTGTSFHHITWLPHIQSTQ
ncbi:hypothetical protein MKX03_017298 [Papaver bracteatum]|nr:hypothetical protein MKX03_017298 [Papaver bracteatum]